MLLITIFVDLRVVAGRSQTCGQLAHRPSVDGHGLEKDGMVRAGRGRGMASVNKTQLHCVNQMGKTHSKPLAAQHGRGTAWAWHAMCESAFKVSARFKLLCPCWHFYCEHLLLCR